MSGPAGSSGVWFCKVWHFLARSGCAGWVSVERGFVLYRKVRHGFIEVLFGDVLFGVAGYSGALHCTALCGKVF